MKDRTVIVVAPRGPRYSTYRKQAQADSLARGEKPIVINAHDDDTYLAGVGRWLENYGQVVVYEDHGWTELTREVVNEAEMMGADVVFRTLREAPSATVEDRFRAAY